MTNNRLRVLKFDMIKFIGIILVISDHVVRMNAQKELIIVPI